MAKQRVFLTGATGTMGFLGMQALLENPDELDVVVLARGSEKNKELYAHAQHANADRTAPQTLRAIWHDADHRRGHQLPAAKLHHSEDEGRAVQQSDRKHMEADRSRER